jgi:hypothetical protein
MDAGIFEYGTKILPSYVPSLPPRFLIQRHEHTKSTIKGTENGFIFYTNKYQYISAPFNLNYDFKDNDPKTVFYKQCEVMVSALCYLNKRDLKPYDVTTITKYISSKSNYIFSVDALYNHLIAYQPNNLEIVIKARDFDILDFKDYDTKLQFLNALKTAEKLVNIKYNYKNIFDLLQECIYNNDYYYLKNDFIIGRKIYNKLSYSIIAKFNLLVTGRQRSERDGLKSYIISDYMYNVTVKSLSLKPQLQNAFIQKGIIKYEKQLKKLNRLVNNRPKAQQLVFILGELLEKQPEIDIVPNVAYINELKAEFNISNK